MIYHQVWWVTGVLCCSLPPFHNSNQKHIETTHHIVEKSIKLKESNASPQGIANRSPIIQDIYQHMRIKDTDSLKHWESNTGETECIKCPILIKVDEFASHNTNETFTTNFPRNSDTVNQPIWSTTQLIQCHMCQVQYVGETGQVLHQSINRNWAYASPTIQMANQ